MYFTFFDVLKRIIFWMSELRFCSIFLFLQQKIKNTSEAKKEKS